MGKRSGTLLCLLIVFAAILPVGQAAGASQAGSPSLLITEVSPSDEGVTLRNVCASSVDLGGWSLTDGEGSLLFGSGTVLAPGEHLTVVAKIGKNWFCSRPGTIQTDDPSLSRSGRFILADSGDDLVLKSGGSVVDQVCWGNSSGAEGWIGGPVRMASASYIARTSETDTDSPDDWTSTRAGWTNLRFPGTSAFGATVTPFSFPESGGAPVYAALESASASVDISIYQLSCPNVVALLSALCERDVRVRILIEAEPLGIETSKELPLLKYLGDRGAEVRMINSGDTPQRFVYLHGKYAVVDGEKVVITSENWTSGNMGYGEGNRGWGAVIEGKGYAGYMEEVFENDFDTAWGDTLDLGDAYPGLKGYSGTLTYSPPDVPDTRSYEAFVSPVLSPDNSFRTLRSFIGSAEYRVYAEEMDLGDSMRSVSGDTPVSWMAAAADRGLDVRFILDASHSGHDKVSAVNLINETTGINAMAVDGGDGFSLIHNKGLVVDGSVWIGSVNWTGTSFHSNRESAVIVTSEEVAQFFSDLFLSDFGVSMGDVEAAGPSLTADLVKGRGGYAVVLRASGPYGSTFVWTLDGQERTTEAAATVFRVSPGPHMSTVRIEGTDVYGEVSFEVPSEGGGGYIIYLSATVILLTGAAVALYRDGPRRNRGDRQWRSGR